MKTAIIIVLALLLLTQVNVVGVARSLQQYGVVGTVSQALGAGVSLGDRNGLNPH